MNKKNNYSSQLKYGIVVVGYNRAKGIERLLRAIISAEYDIHKVMLIISLDYSGNRNLSRMAQEYEWPYGEKKIELYDVRLGLREHILKCGDYMNKYDLDALIVFEDDIIPSKDFFLYSKNATEKYFSNESIAGISLYSYRVNPITRTSFFPYYNGYDNYFMKFAMSWGQVWFRNQWNDFKAWYSNNLKWQKGSYQIPKGIDEWPESSWLKYHIKYCIESNKYFVYPYVSHSTCFNEKGEHTQVDTNDFQVGLTDSIAKSYNFSEFNQNAVRYDAFFEREDLGRHLGIDEKDLEVSLNGNKPVTYKRFLLTTLLMDYRVVNRWSNSLIPTEMNVINAIDGNEVFLYDLGLDINAIELPIISERKSKYELYFELLVKWMELKNRGLSLESFFELHELRNIAIYGWGKIGKLLYDELEHTTISVDYIIDKYCNVDYHVQIKRSVDENVIKNIDAVVITPVWDLNSIVDKLREEGIDRMISVEEIIDEEIKNSLLGSRK